MHAQPAPGAYRTTILKTAHAVVNYHTWRMGVHLNTYTILLIERNLGDRLFIVG